MKALTDFPIYKLSRFGIAFLLCLTAFARAVELPEISPVPDQQAQPFEWELSGYVMLDSDRYTETDRNGVEASESNDELRRLRLSWQFSMLNWEGELEAKGENEADIQDANITYKGFEEFELALGRMKIPSGIENDVSSRHLPLIERSLASEQISLGRGNGVLLSSDSKRLGWKLGFFDNSDWNDEVQDSVLRVFYSPVNKKKQQIHIGYHGVIRNWKNGNYRLRTEGEINSRERSVVSPLLHPEKVYQNGIELAVQKWGVVAQLEYTHQAIKVQPLADEQDSEYQFLQYQLSWLPFGHHRRYRQGVFKKVSGKADWTKLELVARRSEVDGFDNNIGSLVDTTTYGINWYCLNNTKLMVNYSQFEMERPANQTQSEITAWSARLQWEFEL